MRLSELKRRGRLSDVRGRRLDENGRYAVRGRCGSLSGLACVEALGDLGL